MAWDVPAALVGLVVARDCLANLRRGAPGVDIIALLAIAGALATGEHLAAGIIGLMVAGGAALEEFAQGRARRELTALISRTPRIAHRKCNGAVHDVSATNVVIGDILLVKSGEIVPVDGTIAEEAALLDESALTGEPLPVNRGIGEAVRSGVVNVGGPFSLTATATAEQSTYAAVVRLVHSAESERPPMVRLADKWALWFVAATLIVSAVAWIISAQAGRALAVLVVATPCPLILAAPVALICGVSRAARRGIIVKNGGVLERLSRIKIAVFDNTGTVTVGTPRLAGLEPAEGFDRYDLLRLAASLEQASHHAAGAAIIAAARAMELQLLLPQDVTEFSGSGLSGTVGGISVLVGNAGLVAEAGLAVPHTGIAGRMAASAASASWVVVNGQIAGALLLADQVRPEATRALRALRSAGVSRLVMASGDRASSVKEIGAVLGFDAVRPELSPADKVRLVRAERANGPTMMVGDGINDAPALAAADVGVAMGSRGAAAAAEAADAVLLLDRVDRVGEAVAIARRARSIALQSIGAGMGLSIAAMCVAALGYLPPVGGALLQELIDVAVILNALRALASTVPAPLSDRAAIDRVVDDHASLRALLERLRQVADRMNDQVDSPVQELREINERLHALLLPHQDAEERQIFPELANRLGGRDPLRAMNRMHDEIAHLTRRFSAVVAGLDDKMSAAEIHEARRLLYVLDAVIGMHLAAEEDVLSEVEDLPIRPHLSRLQEKTHSR
jgi:heavy metal translocating P-type ATPase